MEVRRMVVLQRQPALGDLRNLIDKVSHYPVSGEDLVKLAISENADNSVLGLFASFPQDQYFLNRDELLTRSEQVRFLNLEK